MKLKMILSMASIALGIGLASSANAKKKEFPTCSFKPTVAVGDFATENLSLGREVAINMRDELVDQLVNSGCYRVVERGRKGIVSSGYDREQAIKAVKASRKGQKAAQSGQVTLADKVVTCALTSVSKNNTGGGISGLGYNHSKYGGGNVNAKSSKISMTCRIYDSSTSEIIASASNSQSKVGVDVGATGGKYTAGMGANFFTESPLGKAVRKLIKKNLVQITKKVQKNPWG